MLGGEVMRYTVTQGFHVGLAHDELEPHLDSVLETLMELGAEDADIGGSLASGEIEISLTVDAGSLRDAQKTADDVIAEAIRLAGGTTAEGNGAAPARSQGPSFDLRSVAAELAGT
jgi:hypothetical protein